MKILFFFLHPYSDVMWWFLDYVALDFHTQTKKDFKHIILGGCTNMSEVSWHLPIIG